MAVNAAVVAWIATPTGIVLDEYVVDFARWMPGLPSVISNGLIPLGIVLLGFYGFYMLLKRRYVGEKNEAIQTIFIFSVTVFIILTVTGIWFRGSGRGRVWPLSIR
jgi:hypothetical protein